MNELKRHAMDLARDYDDLYVSWFHLRRQLEEARTEIAELRKLADSQTALLARVGEYLANQNAHLE